MRIPFIETFSSDPKAAAMLFREEMSRLGLAPLAEHHFLDLLDPVRGGACCQLHNKVCIPLPHATIRPRVMSGLSQPPLKKLKPGCPEDPQPAVEPGDDMTVTGFPCQPYSRQRGERKIKSAEAHKFARVTKDVITGLLTLKPKTFVGENVLGFADQSHDTGTRHCAEFQRALSHVYYTIILEIPLGYWVNAERSRPAPHVEAARWGSDGWAHHNSKLAG